MGKKHWVEDDPRPDFFHIFHIFSPKFLTLTHIFRFFPIFIRNLKTPPNFLHWFHLIWSNLLRNVCCRYLTVLVLKSVLPYISQYITFEHGFNIYICSFFCKIRKIWCKNAKRKSRNCAKFRGKNTQNKPEKIPKLTRGSPTHPIIHSQDFFLSPPPSDPSMKNQFWGLESKKQRSPQWMPRW